MTNCEDQIIPETNASPKSSESNQSDDMDFSELQNLLNSMSEDDSSTKIDTKDLLSNSDFDLNTSALDTSSDKDLDQQNLTTDLDSENLTNVSDKDEDDSPSMDLEILKLTSENYVSYTQLQMILKYNETNNKIQVSDVEKNLKNEDFDTRVKKLSPDDNKKVTEIEHYIDSVSPTQKEKIQKEILDSLQDISELSGLSNDSLQEQVDSIKGDRKTKDLDDSVSDDQIDKILKAMKTDDSDDQDKALQDPSSLLKDNPQNKKMFDGFMKILKDPKMQNIFNQAINGKTEIPDEKLNKENLDMLDSLGSGQLQQEISKQKEQEAFTKTMKELKKKGIKGRRKNIFMPVLYKPAKEIKREVDPKTGDISVYLDAGDPITFQNSGSNIELNDKKPPRPTFENLNNTVAGNMRVFGGGRIKSPQNKSHFLI